MEAVSWAAVVMAAISMIGNAVTTVSNNRTRREMEAAKLAHDNELSGIRHELAACRDVMVIQRQTVETLGSLQREIARAMDKTRTDHHPALPADRRRAADDEG